MNRTVKALSVSMSLSLLLVSLALGALGSVGDFYLSSADFDSERLHEQWRYYWQHLALEEK